MPDHFDEIQSEQDAQFVGWEEDSSGDRFAFYKIIAADHLLFGSKVTEKGLRELNLRVPATPVVKEP
jgi:hypothetical protein